MGFFMPAKSYCPLDAAMGEPRTEWIRIPAATETLRESAASCCLANPISTLIYPEHALLTFVLRPTPSLPEREEDEDEPGV
jgi:hypothetical protein